MKNGGPKSLSAIPTLTGEFSFEPLIGKSRALLDQIEIARSFAFEPEPVLIQGETGTGKELFARGIHGSGPRRDSRFVAMNCAAFPPHLIESEIFGHATGAFTGAGHAKEGLFEHANRGSIFFDEVNSMPGELQPKFLRVLDRGEFRRLGENIERHVDVRVICATNRNMAEEVEAGRFRIDLLNRLNALQINLPPLRDRPEDIPLLAEHWLQRKLSQAPVRANPPNRIAPEAIDMLRSHDWTGNVRELHNVLARAFPRCKGAAIEPHDLALAVPLQIKPGETLRTLKKNANHACERRLVMYFLARNGGKITESAEDCGTERRTFLAVVIKHKLPYVRVRRSRTDHCHATAQGPSLAL